MTNTRSILHIAKGSCNQKRGIRQNVPVTAVRIWAMVAEVILAEENKNEGCSGAAREQGGGGGERRASKADRPTARRRSDGPLLKVNKSLNKGVLVYSRSAEAVHIMCHDVMIVRKIRQDTVRYVVGL